AYDQSKNWERFGRIIAESAYAIATNRFESFLFLSARERYLQMLHDYPRFIHRIPLYHLASYLGIERESLSRIRKELAS
ncbi:MAG: Crp/Fnr family transcriptional regulator, partial [Bacteroidia bacterium]